jgi:hypothetical protein
MVTITYGLTGAPATDGRLRTRQRTPLFARFMKALKYSRLRQARRVIKRHAHLLPPDHRSRIDIQNEKQNYETLFDRT